MKITHLETADIKRELRAYEKKYGMTSAVFQQKYRKGELREQRDFVRWIGLCEMIAASTSRSRAIPA